MPSSNLACAPEILNLVYTAPHRSVLDVGPGFGKYGLLIREFVGGVDRLHAVEAWPDYVTPMMRAIYDTVFTLDVMLMSRASLSGYQLVLMVDVLEHLSKEDGCALLERIRGSIVICTPKDFFQNTAEVEAGIWPEEHRSLWNLEDFQAMSRTEVAYVNEEAAVIARLGKL